MPKRQLFQTVQNSHTIAINGAMPQPVRTGYDYVIAHRVDKRFAAVAKENGKVIEVSPTHIAIQYESGKIDRIEVGVNYGVSSGKVIKNPIVTDYSKDQIVHEGDVVAYNPYHFVRDFMNPSQVLFKNSVLARTVLMESNDTEEDSSAVSERIGGALTTTVTKVRTITIPFADSIYNLVKEGDQVVSDSILCSLEDAAFSETSQLFKSEALDTLRVLANATPRAKYEGKIAKIECIYFGDPETAQISESVKALITKYDNIRKKQATLMKDGRPTTGKLLNSVRVDGNPLLKDHVAIKIYIENTDGVTSGDKFVVSNQLKSVATRVMTGINETKNGEPIDVIFGYQSISNRIVQSAELIGTTNTLLKLISKEVIDIYRQEKPLQ